MKNFIQYINESNIDKNKIKEECKRINRESNDDMDSEIDYNIFIDYSSDNWEEEFIDTIDWDYISNELILSEDFIEYFKNYVNWDNISGSQKISKDFIKKYKDKINFEQLLHNSNISNEFILNNIHWFVDADIEYPLRFINIKFKDKFNKYKKLFGK